MLINKNIFKYTVLLDKDMNYFDALHLLNSLHILACNFHINKIKPEIIPYNKRLFIEHSNKRSIYPTIEFFNNLDDFKIIFNIRVSFWLNYKPFNYKIYFKNEKEYKTFKTIVKKWRSINKYYDTDVSKYFKQAA